MNPCSKYRRALVWLSLGVLEDPREEAVRRHLASCEQCRAYLTEISNVRGNLSEAEVVPRMSVSESFHSDLVRRIKSEQSGPLARLHVAPVLRWRAAFAAAAVAAAIVALIFLGSPSDRATGRQPVARLQQPAMAKAALDPTISNYQLVARQSLEKLDELITEQANKAPAAGHVYTMSSLLAADLAP